jgi:hypothetical protein
VKDELIKALRNDPASTIFSGLGYIVLACSIGYFLIPLADPMVRQGYAYVQEGYAYAQESLTYVRENADRYWGNNEK